MDWLILKLLSADEVRRLEAGLDGGWITVCDLRNEEDKG